MDTCCQPGTPGTPSACPTSGTPGKPVARLTLESLLMATGLARLEPDARYAFCPADSCPVVYFSTSGQVFTTQELSVRVHQKSPEDPTVPACYCFGHTPTSIARELEKTGESTVVKSIAAEVQAARCDCEAKNPQGSCCLGNVTALVKRLRTAID